MIIHTCAQRSPEWFALRAGKLTGSCAKDMLAKVKSGEAAARRDLKFKLLAERLSGTSQEDAYVNDAMRWGMDHEVEAISVYQAATGVLVDPVGFCEHDTLRVGTSPDGLVGDDGIVSIKCPKTATHISYLRGKVEPPEHWAQNTHELWLTGRKWLDFVSYDPRLEDGLQLFIVRVTRTEPDLFAYERDVLGFLAELEHEIEAVRTMANLTAVMKEVAHAV